MITDPRHLLLLYIGEIVWFFPCFLTVRTLPLISVVQLNNTTVTDLVTTRQLHCHLQWVVTLLAVFQFPLKILQKMYVHFYLSSKRSGESIQDYLFTSQRNKALCYEYCIYFHDHMSAKVYFSLNTRTTKKQYFL